MTLNEKIEYSIALIRKGERLALALNPADGYFVGFSGGKDSVMVYPILKWTEAEVWQYIKGNNLPVNPCYARGGRVGCMFCPFAKKQQIEYYEQAYPKFKEHIIHSLEQYLIRYPRNNDRRAFQDAQTYYDWWKSKKSSSVYLAKKQQTEIDFTETWEEFVSRQARGEVRKPLDPTGESDRIHDLRKKGYTTSHEERVAIYNECHRLL